MKVALNTIASYYLFLACAVWLLMGILAFFRPPSDMNLWFLLFMLFTWILPAAAGIYVFFSKKLYLTESERMAADGQHAGLLEG